MQYNEFMKNVYQAKGESLSEQYYDCGKLFKKTIQASVTKIGKSKAQLLVIRRVVAEKTWQNLQDKPECIEFRKCFTAWCRGAEITSEQGMWLMADNLSGCQTVVARYGSGVALLHTEEEFRDSTHIELHMTKPHTICFNDRGTKLSSLVYNNLFPGAGLYGWKKEMIVAVDSIFLREDGIARIETPLLANVVAWIVWRMAPKQADPGKIVKLVKKLGTLADGYAINVVRKVGAQVEGYKLILAREEAKILYLGDDVGDYLKQVNIIDPAEMRIKWALPPRNIWRGGWKYFTGRIKALNYLAAKYKFLCSMSLLRREIRPVHQKIQQMIYRDLAEFFVHADLGAMCVGLIDIQAGTSVSTKLNDGDKTTKIEYLEVID